MVEKDKIRERMGGSGRGDSQDTEKGSSSRARKAKSRSGSGKADSEVSSKDTSSGTSKSGKDWERGDVPRSHIKKVLMAIANSILYAEGKSRAVEEPSNTREEYSKLAADNMYEQYSDIVSQYQVQLIAEKYGFDWADDIVTEVLEDQDYTDKVGV